MLTNIITEAEEITNVKNHFRAHREQLLKLIPSPFFLWKVTKDYLEKSSDFQLQCDSRMLSGVGLGANRAFCMRSVWMNSIETFFALIAACELDRRANPDDPSKEILFCHYEPQEGEDKHGWDETEAILAAEAAPKADPVEAY